MWLRSYQNPWRFKTDDTESTLQISPFDLKIFTSPHQHSPSYRVILPFSIYHKIKAVALMEEQEPQKQQQQTPHSSRPVGSDTHSLTCTWKIHKAGRQTPLKQGASQKHSRAETRRLKSNRPIDFWPQSIFVVFHVNQKGEGNFETWPAAWAV